MRMNTTIHLDRDDIAVYSEVLWEDELGVEGSDQWVRFWSHESDITPDEIHQAVFPMVYRQTNAPAGGYFCTAMRAFQTDHKNEVICVIRHRYDV